MTVAQRAAGKVARCDAPRASHGAWEPSSDRRGPVEVLLHRAATRVPDLVPVRCGRMLASPFTFSRGAAAVMAQGLAAQPHTGLIAPLCGVAHLSRRPARAHARAGDAVAIAAYLGRGRRHCRAPAAFAEACADQDGSDDAVTRAAVSDGRVTPQAGV